MQNVGEYSNAYVSNTRFQILNVLTGSVNNYFVVSIRLRLLCVFLQQDYCYHKQASKPQSTVASKIQKRLYHQTDSQLISSKCLLFRPGAIVPTGRTQQHRLQSAALRRTSTQKQHSKAPSKNHYKPASSASAANDLPPSRPHGARRASCSASPCRSS